MSSNTVGVAAKPRRSQNNHGRYLHPVIALFCFCIFFFLLMPSLAVLFILLFFSHQICANTPNSLICCKVFHRRKDSSSAVSTFINALGYFVLFF